MKFARTIAFLAAILCTYAVMHAADLVTKSGKKYEQFAAAGVSRDGTGIIIIHKDSAGNYIREIIPVADWPDERKDILDKYQGELIRKKKEFAEYLKTPAGKKYLAEKQKREAQTRNLETIKGRTAYVNKLRKEEEAARKREEAARKKEEAAQKKAEDANKKRYAKSSKGGTLGTKKK